MALLYHIVLPYQTHKPRLISTAIEMAWFYGAWYKAPFPWFGGKSKAAPLVWKLLGDPVHYVEPFFGSGAVLLQRPHPCNRPYYSETVCDLDGFVCNFWRAVQWYPEQTAEAASWPVCEADKSARQIALLRWREAGARERLAGDAAWCDPVMAGWWAWAVSVQIGAFVDNSAWTADPVTGCIHKQPLKKREPGVSRDLPFLGNSGRGVVHPGLREPGVLDPITAWHGQSRLDKTDWGEYYHNLTMPELIRWFRHLSARLRHVRVLNGDWSRCCTEGALKMLSVREGKGYAGVFLDPPYSEAATRMEGVYQQDSLSVADEVRAWCLKHTNTPWLRIVLAGFEGEHEELESAGWTKHEWFKDGYLTGGMGNVAKNGTHQQYRERLWASPNCRVEEKSETSAKQLALLASYDEDADTPSADN